MAWRRESGWTKAEVIGKALGGRNVRHVPENKGRAICNEVISSITQYEFENIRCRQKYWGDYLRLDRITQSDFHAAHPSSRWYIYTASMNRYLNVHRDDDNWPDKFELFNPDAWKLIRRVIDFSCGNVCAYCDEHWQIEYRPRLALYADDTSDLCNKCSRSFRRYVNKAKIQDCAFPIWLAWRLAKDAGRIATTNHATAGIGR
jgi:hypothetical protein